MCKVSIIIPVWNAGPTISRCIESLRSQTLKEIEMIFVDDCSADDSMDIVRAAAVEDGRIRILKNEKNMGEGYSRNKGLFESAQGEYLSSIDPDDYVAIDFYELLYQKAREGQKDIVKGLLFPIKSDGSFMWEKPQANKWLREKLSKGIPLYRAFTRGHTTAIYKREFLFSNNVRYSLARRGADVVFLIRACSKTNSISIIDDARYYYCENESSVTQNAGSGQLGYYFDSFHELVEYCLNDLPDNEYTKDYLIELFLGAIRELYRYKNIQERQKDLLYYLSVLRSEWNRLPQGDEWAKDYFPIHVVQEYGYLLPTKPFFSAWEGTNPPVRYALLVRHWVDFYIDTPRERRAALKDLKRLIVHSIDSVNTPQKNFSIAEKNQGRAILVEQIKRLPLRARWSCVGVAGMMKLWHKVNQKL